MVPPMGPSTGPGPPARIDLPALDAVAISYAQRTAGLADDSPERRAARDRLVRAAWAFAARLARRYSGRGEPLEDLEQVARLGLLKSIDRYDPQRGAFTGFASMTITGELRRHFRDRTWGVHVPRRWQELSIEVTRLDAELTTELRRSPSVVELADRLNRRPEEIRAARETAAAYTSLSLNAPRADDSGAELGDEIGGADVELDSVEDRLTVGALLRRLPVRERQILAMRFHGNRTQSEIAAELGISQMHVSRLLSRALTWLRQAMLSDTPQPWQAGPGAQDGPQLTVRSRLAGATALVEVSGEVDRDTAGRLRDALLDAVRRPVREVELSLSGVPFVDAAGIVALLVGFEAGRGAGVRLRIVGVQPVVRRALRVANLRFLLDQRETGSEPDRRGSGSD
jgi:RNA polymerase sigma-B factor